MSTGVGPRVGEILPTDAWAILKADNKARLIDVRTHAEWNFVGVPDLSELRHTLICIEWSGFPGMSRNPRFADTVIEELGDEAPGNLLFICRSGVRSLLAAKAVTARYGELGHAVDCFNVIEGFEGDLNANGRRGLQNGWKHRGLAWRQS